MPASTADEVVNAINASALPRYGLGNYIKSTPHEPPTEAEAKEIKKLPAPGSA